MLFRTTYNHCLEYLTNDTLSRIFIIAIYLVLILGTTVSSYQYLNHSTLTITDNSKKIYQRVIPNPRNQNRYYKNVTQDKTIASETTTLVTWNDWKNAHGKTGDTKDLSNVTKNKYSELKSSLHETLSYAEVPYSLITFFVLDFVYILIFKKLLSFSITYRIVLNLCKFITLIPILFYVAPNIMLKIFSDDKMNFSGIFEKNQNLVSPAVILFTMATFIY